MKNNTEHINRLRAELKELIESKADYNLILKKSQELDEYIFEELLKLNKFE